MLRKLITALSALALIMAGSVTLAPAANAADGGNFCFRYKTNNYPYDRQNVYIQLSDDKINWAEGITVQSDAFGCGAFTVWGTWTMKYVRAYARQEVRTSLGGVAAVWSGTAPIMTVPGSGYTDLGTGIVTCVSRTVYPCP
jgi:hypothetical protein